MSLEDPTMGETFSSWTGVAERDPPKFDPGKLHTGTGIKDWWFQDGYLFRERDGIAISAMDERLWWDQIGNYEFIEGCQWSVEESAATKKVTPGKSELALNTMPAWGVPGETPEEGEWPARDRVPFVETIREGRYTITGIAEGKWSARDLVPVVRDAAYWRSVTNGVFAFDPALGPDHMPARGFAEQTIGLRPAEVTSAMRDQGMVELAALIGVGAEYGGLPEMRNAVTAIYRAMHAAAPVPLVSDAEIALTKERDEARAELAAAIDENGKLALEWIREKTANIALRDTVARFTAANAAEPPAPDPIANAIRPREVDPRRMGLA